MQLFANPCDTNIEGFSFETYEEFEEGLENYPEGLELTIDFIDGDNDEAELFGVSDITPANLKKFFDMLDQYNKDYQRAALYYLMDDLNYSMEDAIDKVDDVFLREGSLSDVAAELFDDLYAHSIPEGVRCYIDYDAFAHDCEVGGDLRDFDFDHETYTVTNVSCL